MSIITIFLQHKILFKKFFESFFFKILLNFFENCFRRFFLIFDVKRFWKLFLRKSNHRNWFMSVGHADSWDYSKIQSKNYYLTPRSRVRVEAKNSKSHAKSQWSFFTRTFFWIFGKKNDFWKLFFRIFNHLELIHISCDKIDNNCLKLGALVGPQSRTLDFISLSLR